MTPGLMVMLLKQKKLLKNQLIAALLTNGHN